MNREPLTLLTVAHPRAARELRHCAASYRRFAREPFVWLWLTEAEHVAALREILPGEDVRAMPPAAEAIPHGYWRQQAAKLLAPLLTDAARLVITDDDTEAIAPWSGDTFFDGQGRARIYYRGGSHYWWRHGQQMIFGDLPPRDFQLLLPFAIRGETLAALAQSDLAARCLRAWQRSQPVSEFSVMGEYAWRYGRDHAVFADVLRDRSHWTLGIGDRPSFRDWQGHRTAFRRRVARGAAPPLQPVDSAAPAHPCAATSTTTISRSRTSRLLPR